MGFLMEHADRSIGGDGAGIPEKDSLEDWRAEQVICDFFSAVSKELKAPLTTILGLIQILSKQRELEPEGREKLLFLMERKGLELASLSEEIMEIVRARFGHGPSLRLAAVSVGSFVTPLNRHLSHLPPEYRVDVDFRDSDCLLMIDRKKIGQVLESLISGSIRLSPDGGRIAIEGYRSGGYYTIRVSDSGAGMSPQELGRFFDPFYRYDLDPLLGRGLRPGMGTIRKYAEAHGGTLSVTSIPGKGTTSTVRLPVFGQE